MNESGRPLNDLDHIAIQIMAGLCANSADRGDMDDKAEWSYRAAWAMLRAREVVKPEGHK